MSNEAVQITITGNIKGDVANRIREIGAAARSSHTDVDLLKQALQGFSALGELKQAASNTKSLSTAIKGATAAQHEFTAANTATVASLNNAGAAAGHYATTLKQIDGASVKLASSTNNLKSGLGSLVGLFGGVFALVKYKEAQDAFTNIQNSLKSITTTTQQATAVQNALFAAANRSRVGVESFSAAFVNFNKALAGTSKTDVLRFTETLTKSLIVAGRTTSEVNSVITQLGQALTSGKLQGDEFRSLAENAPIEVMQALAKELGVTRVELKALGSEGKITADVIKAAILGMSSSVEEAFAKTLPTIGQAFTILNNQFIAFTASTSAGAQIVSGAIILIANNLTTIIPLVAAFAAVWLTIKAGAIIYELALVITGTLIPALYSAALATVAFLGPIGVIVTAFVLLVATLAYVTGALDPFINAIKNTITGMFDLAQNALGLSTSIEDASGGLDDAAKAAINGASGMNAFAGATASASSGIADLGNNAGKAAKQTTDAIFQITKHFKAMTEAATAAHAAAYSALQAAGGSQGSFTALPSSKDSTPNGNTITSLPVPKSSSFASGGSAMVTGRAGIDKNLVRIAASKGERITVETKKQQRENDNKSRNQSGDRNFTFIINTPDADSFRRSRRQVASEMQTTLGLV